ncbi:MAG: electron transport complex subunit RsxG [Thiogranum sp.]
MSYRPILISATFLFLFAVIGSGLVAFTFDSTAERIADNQRKALLKSLNELVPSHRYDNDIFADTLYAESSELLGTDQPIPVYRARKNGWPVAAVLAAVAPDGYNGPIRLLVAVNLDGTLAGVRVVQHRETPGLGDAVEAERSDWIQGFKGKSLTDPAKKGWKVKRDGGIFDQFTGATITPRAVVKAVHKALLYFQLHAHKLFEESPDQATDS